MSHEHSTSSDSAVGRLAALLPSFAAAAAGHDSGDEFVAANFNALRAARLMSLPVPVELGGDGLTAAEMSPLLQGLAQACPATALAFAMHLHGVTLIAWRWRHQQAPVEPLLRRVAQDQIVILSSGGSDWLESSGKARRVEGGFVIDAVKGFASAAPAGTLLNTSAIWQEGEEGPTVLHFMVPLDNPAVTIEPTWQAMGMRGTGSHHVHIKGWFVPDAAVAARRPQGKWHPLFHMVSMLAIPLIYSVYAGVAQALRDAVIAEAGQRGVTPARLQAVGEMETDLAGVRYALADMLAATGARPGPETTNRVFLGRAALVRSLQALGDSALAAAQGAGYLRTRPVERLYRDLLAARFHPLPVFVQRELAGRMALGLEIDPSPV